MFEGRQSLHGQNWIGIGIGIGLCVIVGIPSAETVRIELEKYNACRGIPTSLRHTNVDSLELQFVRLKLITFETLN